MIDNNLVVWRSNTMDDDGKTGIYGGTILNRKLNYDR